MRQSRKTLIGEVIGRSGIKTIKVAYFYKAPHPLYHKEVKRKTVVHVHDEKDVCQVGDRVKIMETRPISRLKRWRVVSIIQQNQALAL